MGGIALRQHRVLGMASNAILCPTDDSLISGTSYLERPSWLYGDEVLSAGASSVLGFAGSISRQRAVPQAGRIVNLTVSTVRSSHTRKVLASSVVDAIGAGGDAVAFHLNLGSRFEHEMLELAGRAVSSAHSFEIPVLGICYPRTEGIDGRDDNFESVMRETPALYESLVVDAAIVGAELGADMVKVRHPGSREGLLRLVERVSPVPVFVAGGPLVDDRDLASMVLDIKACHAHVSFGRNVARRPRPANVVRAVREILNTDVDLEGAVELIRLAADPTVDGPWSGTEPIERSTVSGPPVPSP